MKPIPFDNLCLAAVVAEMRPWVGAKIQRVSQPLEDCLVLEIHRGQSAWFLISVHPVYCRAHFSTRKPANPVPTPGLCAALRGRMEGAFIEDVSQPNGDRVLVLTIRAGEARFYLVAELLGKHANIILLDDRPAVAAALRTYGPNRSTRPIQMGQPYPPLPPPSDPRSPFLRRWIEAGGDEGLIDQVGILPASYVPGVGAYPLPLEGLGYPAIPRDSMSTALEQAFEARIANERTERTRRELLHSLKRIELAREVAIHDLYEARDLGQRANGLQRQGELILAYAHEWRGERQWVREDYDGTPLTLRMDPELSAHDNAKRIFDKAKRAKARQPMVEEQLSRLEEDLVALRRSMELAESASEPELAKIAEEADRRRWRHAQVVATKPEERPFEGHRIREYLGPAGFTVLVGENALANDYLTIRVAKPDDWWLHVRGTTSAHVIIRTNKHPERVSKEVFEFAAKLAVRHSTQKHASYVPVDITQRRYVRRLKGSAPGTVQYTHERTIHVDV